MSGKALIYMAVAGYKREEEYKAVMNRSREFFGDRGWNMLTFAKFTQHFLCNRWVDFADHLGT